MKFRYLLPLLLFLASPLQAQQVCDKSAAISVAAANTQEIVPLVSGSTIYVCGFIISGDTLATTGVFKTGTGTSCGTGTVSITGAMRMPDEGSIVFGSGVGLVFQGAPSSAVCITAATGAITGILVFRQQ